MQQSLRQSVALTLEVGARDKPVSRLVDALLISLILLNVLAVVLDSLPSFALRYREPLDLFELFSICVFTIEYLLRVWSAVELKEACYRQPVTGRLRFICSPLALIDLMAILPFYLTLFTGLDLRFLRVLRILRIFKLSRYSSALSTLLAVFKEEAEAFIAAFFVLMILLILASSGIYLLEHKVQPDVFGSIPQAMWWAMATLTTVGYGDVIPVTAAGKFFGGCITIIGIGMVALPAGILASGFSEQMRRRREAYQLKLKEALSDGVIDNIEEQELEQLQRLLDISRDDAELLRQQANDAKPNSKGQCPCCHRSWS